MLSSSPLKIHEPRVTGVSPRPTDRRQRQKLRNTSGPQVPLARVLPRHPLDQRGDDRAGSGVDRPPVG
jgi:hypothetical protein